VLIAVVNPTNGGESGMFLLPSISLSLYDGLLVTVPISAAIDKVAETFRLLVNDLAIV
jgi:hypothetical protein